MAESSIGMKSFLLLSPPETSSCHYPSETYFNAGDNWMKAGLVNYCRERLAPRDKIGITKRNFSQGEATHVLYRTSLCPSFSDGRATGAVTGSSRLAEPGRNVGSDP